MWVECVIVSVFAYVLSECECVVPLSVCVRYILRITAMHFISIYCLIDWPVHCIHLARLAQFPMIVKFL